MELQLDQYYDKGTKIFTYPEKPNDIKPNGLAFQLFEKMKENLKKVAQIEAESGKKDLYESYMDRIIRTALKMKSMGIGPGDIISICSYNHLNNTVPLVAALFIGAKVASMDPTLSLEDTKHLMNLVKPKMVFASVGSEKLVEDAAKAMNISTVIVSFGGSDGFADFADFIGYKGDVDGFEPYKTSDINETVLILFSSGTTGMPKGICLSNGYFLSMLGKQPLAPDGVVLLYSSLYWISKTFITFMCIYWGTAQCICRLFDQNLVWHYIEKYKITIAFFSSCDAIKISQVISEVNAPSLTLIAIGGSLVPWDVLQKLRAALPKAIIFNAYALTECFNIMSSTHPIPYSKKDCVGIPVAGLSYKVVDPDTEEPMGFNQPGELRVKSRWCMNGYYKQDSSGAWDSDGFLKTGDMVYYDEEFCFFIVDRIKEMFKYKSWHVVPAKVEKILLAHPEVMYAVVIGVPHRQEDNHAVAVVVPTIGAKIKPEDLKKFVDDQVDERHRLVGGVRFVKTLPMTPTSKIQRRAVAKMVVNNEI